MQALDMHVYIVLWARINCVLNILRRNIKYKLCNTYYVQENLYATHLKQNGRLVYL